MKPKSSSRLAAGSDEPSAAEGRAGFRLQGFLPYLLSVAANRVSGLVARRYQKAFGITIPEWRCLAVIGSAGRVSASEIATLTAMDKVKVSRALASLETKGLVRRTPHPTDGRLALVSFTPRGRTMYERIVPLALETEREVLAGLSDVDKQFLREGLVRLLARIEALEQGNGGG
ncbi:MAG: MarR family transcriptional regulator [Elioraea sp.]|nr:MarR family transcriptional regulator [Elioraea sp.]